MEKIKSTAGQIKPGGMSAKSTDFGDKLGLSGDQLHPEGKEHLNSHKNLSLYQLYETMSYKPFPSKRADHKDMPRLIRSRSKLEKELLHDIKLVSKYKDQDDTLNGHDGPPVLSHKELENTKMILRAMKTFKRKEQILGFFSKKTRNPWGKLFTYIEVVVIVILLVLTILKFPLKRPLSNTSYEMYYLGSRNTMVWVHTMSFFLEVYFELFLIIELIMITISCDWWPKYRKDYGNESDEDESERRKSKVIKRRRDIVMSKINVFDNSVVNYLQILDLNIKGKMDFLFKNPETIATWIVLIINSILLGFESEKMIDFFKNPDSFTTDIPKFETFFMALQSLNTVRIIRIPAVFLTLANIFEIVSDVRYTFLLSLMVSLVFALTIAIVFYLAEFETNDNVVSIYSTLYWSCVTSSTVGYGDTSPITTIGMIATCIYMILFIPLFVLSSGIVSTSLALNFQRQADMKKDMVVRRQNAINVISWWWRHYAIRAKSPATLKWVFENNRVLYENMMTEGHQRYSLQILNPNKLDDERKRSNANLILTSTQQGDGEVINGDNNDEEVSKYEQYIDKEYFFDFNDADYLNFFNNRYSLLIVYMYIGKLIRDEEIKKLYLMLNKNKDVSLSTIHKSIRDNADAINLLKDSLHMRNKYIINHLRTNEQNLLFMSAKISLIMRKLDIPNDLDSGFGSDTASDYDSDSPISSDYGGIEHSNTSSVTNNLVNNVSKASSVLTGLHSRSASKQHSRQASSDFNELRMLRNNTTMMKIPGPDDQELSVVLESIIKKKESNALLFDSVQNIRQEVIKLTKPATSRKNSGASGIIKDYKR